ncbi:hypothetical protein DB30_04079 [Enhygromyxa salina]|uniref:Uncharacterized protein n=1 Tax=Enhygromyxa salina TaxID=215803 RepID=A0A0C2DAK1_9BACT|nr:hypothetical protein [Enhygromyxa salina]KIG16917.1 hypothetical protein DB30_04079 [Enhygromyxa salina]
MESAEISSPACSLYAGKARDTTLQGSPPASQARCCETDFGFDAQLVARSCGFKTYLGGSEELACVHRFEDDQGHVREFRLTPILDLAFEAAIALHEQGEFGESHQAGPAPDQPTLWISTSETHHWALIPGWSATRRLSWEPSACAVEQMGPVLAAMAAAPPTQDAITPLPRLELDAARDAPIEAGSLLARYAAAPRDADPPAHYPLPRAAPALVEHTLRAAAAGDLDAFTSRVSPAARFGLPDRRQLSGRALLSDGGVTAMTAVRRSANRLASQLELRCPQIDRRMLAAVRTGDELMWCVWASDDGLDLLVFALRGRADGAQADAMIEYVGAFPQRPTQVLRVPGEPPPMPARPRPTLACGDPHAVDYPGQCPQSEREDDEDDDDDDDDDGADDQTIDAAEYGR